MYGVFFSLFLYNSHFHFSHGLYLFVCCFSSFFSLSFSRSPSYSLTCSRVHLPLFGIAIGIPYAYVYGRNTHTHTGVMATNRAATTFNIPNQQQNYTTAAHRTTQCIRIRSTILRHKWRQLGIKCFTNVSTVANFEAGAIYAKFTTTTICHVTHNGQCCNIFLVTHSVYIYI